MSPTSSDIIAPTPISDRRSAMSASSESTVDLDGPTPVSSRCCSPKSGIPKHMPFYIDPLEGDTPVATPAPTRPSSPMLSPKRSASPTPTEKTIAVDEKREDLESGVRAKKIEGESDEPSELSRTSLSTVFGATLLMFVCFGFSNSAGVFQSYYAANKLQHLKPATISWIGSTHLSICFASGIVSGSLFDRGWYRVQLTVGSLGWIACLFLLSISKSFGAILATHGIGLGLSLGIVFSPTLAIIGLYFRKNRAFMLGITAAGGGLGSIAYPLVLNAVLPKLGFAMTVRIIGFASIPLLAIANLTIRPRTPVLPPVRQSMYKITTRALCEKQTWGVCGGIAAGMSALFVSIFYVQVFFKAQPSLPRSLSSNCLAILQAFAVIGRLSGGRLADRFGLWRTVVPACASTGASVFLLLASSNTAAAIIFLIVFGTSSGVLLSVSPGCFMRLSANPSEMGLRSGLGFCFVAMAALVSPSIAGTLLVAANGRYIAPCAFAGGIGILGSALILLGSTWLERARKASASALTA